MKNLLQKRYGITSVRVSDIADQLYCEKKVELRLLHPEVRKTSRELLTGQQAHDALAADAVRISEHDFRAQLASGKKVLLRESIFAGHHKGIPILDKPDLVEFDGLKALLVVDYKFSAKREPYPDHRLQLALYGMLLHKSKFDTSELVTVLVFVSSQQMVEAQSAGILDKAKEDELLKLCRHLRKTSLRRQEPASTHQEDFSCFAYPFEFAKARRLLDERTGFWLGHRPAVPTEHEKKCRVCEYNAAGLCDSALTKPDRDFLKSIRTTA